MFRATAANLKLLNPDFEYLFFDDQQVEAFIDEHFPDYRPLYDSFPWRIQRYDFFRYLAVYQLGGFYFDQDLMLAETLATLLDAECVFPFERLTWSDYIRDECGLDWELGNYAFGAAAGHPFLRAVIDNCLRAQEDRAWEEAATRSLPRLLRNELRVIYSTGPGLVTRTFAEFGNARSQVTVLFPHKDVCDKQNWNLFGSYGIHLGVGSWRSQYGPIRRRLLNFYGWRCERRAIRLGKTLGTNRATRVNPGISQVGTR
jgi:mannosyltransferase OCH1-like enzyme